uniref:Biogenesis of lysosome-related organelles complex 1 subunit 2-like n=1 Tax=Sinocyclocheilus grahami TaxID=75366 RepID=A0A672TFX0_SINGR
MAATGEEAAAMDSICKAPAPPTDLKLTAEHRRDEATNDATDNPKAKRPSNNNNGGVETAEEATEPAQPDINELCRDMFDKMSVFLQGELTGNDNNRRTTMNIFLSFAIYIELCESFLFRLLSNLRGLQTPREHGQTHQSEVHGDEGHIRQHQPQSTRSQSEICQFAALPGSD